MSAHVYPKCGHVYHSVEVVRMEKYPHIHMHFLTEEWEYKFLEYLKLEICCHGCGNALLLYYEEVEEEDVDIRTQICDDFKKEHRKCPNRGFEKICLNYRSKIDFMDLRHAEVEAPTISDEDEEEAEMFLKGARLNEYFTPRRHAVRG